MITCKHFTPGHPDFEAECAKSTPLHQIRKGYSQRRNDITADMAPVLRAMRNETADKLRG